MDSRKYDIYDIKRMRKKAKNAFERKQCDKALKNIYKQEGNNKVKRLRNDLTMATRGNDIRKIKYLDRELRKHR